MPPEAPVRYEAAVAFVAYTVAVLFLAVLSHRLLKKRAFLKEYFLGSRGLGLWALAMTYAATSSSGGSFTGFPALIYSHGWILALWIASYMVVPVCCMGLLGKRLNQVARKSGAITIPDVFRDRFRSPAVGIVTSLLMAFFLTFNLVAQFKAGALIVDRLVGDFPLFRETAAWVAWLPETVSVLSDSPPTAGYCLALLLFAAAVIAYTAYGGFRAVVWTDVLQGVVMFIGVLLLLGFTLASVNGGLDGATRELASWRHAAVDLQASEDVRLEPGTELVGRHGATTWRLANDWPVTVQAGSPATVGFRALAGVSLPEGFPDGTVWSLEGAGREAVEVKSVRHEADHGLVSGPGFRASSDAGFLPLSLAFSFFIMWAISGAGQPTTMVRLMAFKDTKVYRRAMFSVSIYYTLIYIPLVISFVCARQLMPTLEEPDQAMPALVLLVIPGALAGIILAAPFAAVMSTVDSFLLAISSSLVRDVYQRGLRPNASPRTIRRLSYATTLVVGIVVMLGALNPPRFLQHIIVLTSAGLACSLLAPMFFTLYWRRMNARGCLAGILGGFGTCFGLYVWGWTSRVLEPHPLGFLPLVWGLLASIICSVAGSLSTRPPPADLVEKYFKAPANPS